MRRREPGESVKYVPYAATTAVAIAVVLVLGTVESVGRESVTFHAEDALHFAALLVSAGSLALRRPWPLVAVIVTGAINAVALLQEWPSPGYQVSWLIAIFSYTLVASLRAAVLLTGVCTALGIGAVLATGDWGVLSMKPLSILIVVPFAATLGYVFQLRDERVRASGEAAAALEADRAAEVERRLAEQRLDTARDLHDAVGHQLTVISLNASNALDVWERSPTDAKRAVGTIGDAAAGLIEEIGRVLEELRAPGEPGGATPGFDQLPDLVARFEREGLEVRFELIGNARPIREGRIVYRVVQEALVNALRYADISRGVSLRVEISDTVRIRVVNDVADNLDIRVGAQYGLTGIREQVEPLGGTVTGRRRDGKFRLAVTVPVSERDAA